MNKSSQFRLRDGQRRLLHDLLNRFERANSERSIAVSVNAERFPGYFDDADPAGMREWDESVRILQAQGWIALDLGKGADSHRIVRIRLNRERVGDIEAALGRMSVASYRAECCRIFERFCGGFTDSGQPYPEWWKRLLADERASLLHGAIPQAGAREQVLNELGLLLTALQALAGRVSGSESPLSWRQFSVSVFSESKKLDSLKPRIVRLVRGYAFGDTDPEAGAAGDDSAVLSHFGIELKEEVLFFHGPVVLRSAAGSWSIDARAWRPFVSVPGSMLIENAVGNAGEKVVWDLREVRRILTIENEESFHAWARKPPIADWLVIYLGGFPSRRKLRLLRELACFGLPMVHWGDIDCGGIEIFLVLERELEMQPGMSIEAIGMDRFSLESHREQGQALSAAERRRLAALKERLPAGHRIRPTLDAMLELGIKLEQEAIVNPVTSR